MGGGKENLEFKEWRKKLLYEKNYSFNLFLIIWNGKEENGGRIISELGVFITEKQMIKWK